MLSSLHDVGLVDRRDLLPPILQSKIKRKFRYPLGLRPANNLQRLDDARNRLMFQARIFSFGVFPDDGEIDACVASREALEIFHV